MSLASLFRSARVVVPGGRHAAPDAGDRPAVAFNPAPGRHASPDDDGPALDLELGLSIVVGADFGGAAPDDSDLLDSLGFAYEA